MSKGEETRQAIIERAAPLFNQRGFYGCSMSDIMAATGLQKGGIYRHFSSKEELAQAAFRYSSEASVRLRSAGVAEGSSPLHTLRAYVAHFVEAPSAVPGGCPFLNTAVDADDGNEDLRKLVEEAFRAWRGRVVSMIQGAIDAGELQHDTDRSWLANAIISTLEGAVMLSRLERNKDPLLHAAKTLNLVLDSVALKSSASRKKSNRTSR